MSNFYIVESSGSAAVWQVDPQGIVRQMRLKRKWVDLSEGLIYVNGRVTKNGEPKTAPIYGEMQPWLECLLRTGELESPSSVRKNQEFRDSLFARRICFDGNLECGVILPRLATFFGGPENCR